MRTIWKFGLAVEDVQTVDIPAGAQILSVQTQRGALCVWAVVDPAAKMEQRTFWIRGTGHDVGDDMRAAIFVGTTQMLGGDLVWHVFVSP